MQTSGQIESINASHALGIRPLCRCCGGGEIRSRRGSFKHVKAKSRFKNKKARRGKAKHKDHRS